ncbi:MAG TPA: zinc dependent phospholipase C family protein [Chloroflexota bacterium]|nr:zinc dependent phospholipase C family protein [Chloroflexota bacterium]
MPRLRCHWALLSEARRALLGDPPPIGTALGWHRAEYFAGGVAPDALRLFAGADKPSTHFYDDQRRETWDARSVIRRIATTHPQVADPTVLDAPAQAWLAGYLAHIAADVAYWEHVLPHLPPFPERSEAHHGAWLIADDCALDAGDRTLDPEAVDYAAAPPWVDAHVVKRMLTRLQSRILVDGMWPVELAYFRARPEAEGRSDDELLADLQSAWESNLAQAREMIPAAAWDAFRAAAVRRASEVVRAYLAA